jgi:hypothetical protein
MSNTRKSEISVPESTVYYGRLWRRPMEIIDGKILDLMKGRDEHVQRMLVHVDGTMKSYDAINENVLEPFSRLDFSESNILDFATKYGNLAGTVLVERDVPQPQTSLNGEPLSRWVSEIDNFKETYQLYSAWRRKETSELEKRISWKKGPMVQYKSPFQTRNLANSALGGLEHFQEGDVHGPAFFHVQTTVNEYLYHHTATHLYFGLEFKPPRFVGLDPGRHAPSLFLVPKNLLGAIWLQFAKIIDRRSAMQRCVTCRNLFAVGGGRQNARRGDARCCSDQCRWGRRKLARDLAREGHMLREIAKTLGADLPTVRGWLKHR